MTTEKPAGLGSNPSPDAGSLTRRERRVVSQQPEDITEHNTDGPWCWCGPTAERQPDGSYVLVHRTLVA